MRSSNNNLINHSQYEVLGVATIIGIINGLYCLFPITKYEK